MAKKWAIVVGLNQYYFSLPSLRYAKGDAEAMKNWLEEAGFDRVFLFTEDSLPILPITTDNTKPIPSQPTYGCLKAFLNIYFENLKQPLLTTGDSLWFFFSGHGVRAADGDYLMLVDSVPTDVISSAISVNYVTERLRRSGAGNVVLFLDACRNEGGSKGGKGFSSDTYQGIITFYSCSPQEQSYEIDDLQQGAFTHVLLKALRQSKEKCFTVEKLEQYFRQEVPLINSKHGKPRQSPVAKVELIDKRIQILFGKPEELDIEQLKLAAYTAKYQGNRRLERELWIQVNIAAEGRDEDALSALTRIVLTNQEKKLLIKYIPSVNETSKEQLENYLSQLQLAAYRAAESENFELARELSIQVNIAAKGQDMKPLLVLAKIAPKDESGQDLDDEKIELISGTRIDYTQLRNFLNKGQWQEADQETTKVMLKIANRQEKGWLRTEDIELFPCSDIQTMNQLWVKCSQGQFGFSIQKQIWLSISGQTGEFNSTIFNEFGKRVNWRVGNNWLKKYEHFTFSLDAPQGHLPSLRFPGVENQMNCWQSWNNTFKSFLLRWENCLL